jgi:hypothetical protein
MHGTMNVKFLLLILLESFCTVSVVRVKTQFWMFCFSSPSEGGTFLYIFSFQKLQEKKSLEVRDPETAVAKVCACEKRYVGRRTVSNSPLRWRQVT